jgi:hypothetical protein
MEQTWTSGSSQLKVVYDAGEANGQARAVVGRVHEEDGWLVVERPGGEIRILKSRVFFVGPAAWRDAP